MNGRLKIGFTSKIVPVKPINEQMTLCKCYVMAIGKNQNKSNIPKEAVDDALPSLFNIPVVGHLYVDKENNCRMGGHDMALERDENGKYKFKVLTVPYGTVPQQEGVHYEEVTEKDGTINLYQVADIILWTGRYPELLDAKYSDGIYFAQSMEIIPMETSKEDGYINIDKFQYSALCLLGKSDDRSKNVEPCFESARVEPYDFSLSEEWTKLFGEFKEELAKSYVQHNFEKGGKTNLDIEKLKSIFCELGLPEDTKLSFEIGDMTEEMVKAKISELYLSATSSEQNKKENSPGTNSSVTEEGGNKKPIKFAVELTYEEKRKGIRDAFASLCYWDEDEYKYYDLIDFDNKYAYGCYHIKGEHTKEDSGTIRVPYTFGTGKVELHVEQAEKVRQVWLTKADEDKIEEEKKQMDSLIDFKKSRLEEDRRKEYSAVISEFSDLSEIDEFKTVVKDAMTFESVDALTEKLYAIRGKYIKKPAKKALDTIRIPVGFEAKGNKNSEIDEFMSKYLHEKSN